MTEPEEPHCPPGHKPHKDRVRIIDNMLIEGKTGCICIDNTPVYREWYLHEIAKYPRLRIVFQGDLTRDTYLIRVLKLPSAN